MLSEEWQKIDNNYKIAKECLWCPRHVSGWMRQEDKGRYHLWQAYYEAKAADRKEDYILYARILMIWIMNILLLFPNMIDIINS